MIINFSAILHINTKKRISPSPHVGLTRRTHDPEHWFHLVLAIGTVHAVAVAVSLGWLIARSSVPAIPLAGLESLATCLLAALSVFLAFLAYAADSRTMLQQHPEDSSADWQAVGGLVGVSLVIALFHVLICAQSLRSGFPGDWLIVYKLLFPTLIVGGLGAAAGITVALVAHGILRGGER